jgi:hypothetical protein
VLIGSQAKNPTTGGGGSGMVNPSYRPSPFQSMSHRLGVAPPPPRLNNCSAAHWEDGIDYYDAASVGQAHGTGAADCCSQCAAIPECKFFSFKKTGTMGHTCFFKSSNNGRRKDPNVISAVVAGQPAPAPSPSPAGAAPQLLFAESAEQAVSLVGGADTVAIVFVATSSVRTLRLPSVAASAIWAETMSR